MMKRFISNNILDCYGFIRVMQNTNFFHSIVSSRKQKNLVSSLTIDGVESRDPEVSKSHVLHYYK
jgi:hypothetical protein